MYGHSCIFEYLSKVYSLVLQSYLQLRLLKTFSSLNNFMNSSMPGWPVW